MLKKIWKKIASYLAIIAILINVFAPLAQIQPVFAQEATPDAQVTGSPTPTPDSSPSTSPSPDPTPTPTDTPSPSSESIITPSPTPQPEPTPEAVPSATLDLQETSPSAAPSDWQTIDSSATTINNVELGKTYTAPQNDKVSVTFTKLPANPGKLTIKEITLTPEQVTQTGALSNKAYDITSDMPDGTFTYTLKLPIPQSNLRVQNAKIKYAENLDQLSSAQTVDQTKQQGSDSIAASNINHFTIFIVYSQTENLWGAYTSQHNTSATPNSYFAPGDTAAVYDNFTLGSNTSITGINWRGVYYDGPPQPLCDGISSCASNSDGAIPPTDSYGWGPAAKGTIAGFTIKVYSDIIDSSGGSLNGLHRPNIEAGPIYTAAISGNASETDLGYTDSEHVYYGPNEIYSYGTTLATPFAATGGTKYWLSIIAESPFAPEWGWNTAGVVGSGLAYRQDQGNPTLKKNISGADFTFSLSALSSVFVATAANGGSDSNTGSDAAHPLATIQTALNSVAAGGTVHVAAGTYTEQLTINKNVTISGAGRGSTTIQAPDTLVSDADGANDIVLVTGSSVTTEISGFTIQGPVNGLNFGIYVRDGATANIHDNTIKDIRDNPLSGNQYGYGIEIGKYHNTVPLVDQVGHATITNNIVTGYQKTGIETEGTGSSATITGNTVTGAGLISTTSQNGIQIRRGATGSIINNVVTGNTYTGHEVNATGISVTYPGNNVIIQNNTVNHNTANIYTYQANGVQVLNNTISDSSDGRIVAGITADSDDVATASVGITVTISGNTIKNNLSGGTHQGPGIFLWGVKSGTVNGNEIVGSGYDGILIGASGNIAITNNRFSGNGLLVSNPNAAAIDFGGIIPELESYGLQPNPLGGFTVHNNLFLSNRNNIWSYDSGNVNATNNDWGVYTEPTISSTINGNVNFDPFIGATNAVLAPTVTLDTSKTIVTVNNTTSDSTINIPSGVTDATLDVSDPGVLTDNGTTKTATISGDITINSNTANGPVTVMIPAGTTISGASTDWNGIINAPTVSTNAAYLPSAPNGMVNSLGAEVEVGFGDVPLTLSSAVRILIQGQGGHSVGYIRSGVFTPITTICNADDQAIVDGQLGPGADCSITTNAGSDLAVWTKHFTQFVTYSQITQSSSSNNNNSSNNSSNGTTSTSSTNSTPAVNNTQVSNTTASTNTGVLGQSATSESNNNGQGQGQVEATQNAQPGNPSSKSGGIPDGLKNLLLPLAILALLLTGYNIYRKKTS